LLKDKNILLGVTGGIAAYKTATLTRLLKKAGANVKIIMTPASQFFITPLTLSTLSENPVYSEFANTKSGEWNSHVEFGLWADLFIIAPATANTIAKMANGICDNLLMATYLSSRCPIYIAPAMDLDMYEHPTTKRNINELKNFGYSIIEAQHGELASGLIGKGRMEEPEVIHETILNHFSKKKTLNGKKVLITAGPTYEQIDPVRFIGNNSSGKMGLEIAKKATELGAEVFLVIGPTSIEIPSNINTINVKSAQEMYDAVHNCFADTDIAIMAAAVADYTPVEIFNSKIKKKTNALSIDLKPTKDILKSVGSLKKESQILIGFALETDNEKENAIKKVKEKNLDFIVLNSLNDKGAGFGHETNKVTIIDKNNNFNEYELKSKADVASDIFNQISTVLDK